MTMNSKRLVQAARNPDNFGSAQAVLQSSPDLQTKRRTTVRDQMTMAERERSLVQTPTPERARCRDERSVRDSLQRLPAGKVQSLPVPRALHRCRQQVALLERNPAH